MSTEQLISKVVVAVKLLLFMIALNCFFVSIKLLGAFKGLGMGYGEKLIVDLAANPAVGLLVGIFVTSVIQSSSTTTSLVVGLVAGGVFGEDPIQAARLAVPVIMGANVGTAVTSTLVSLGHIGNRAEFQRAFQAGTVHDLFNLLAVAVWFPVQVATNFLGRISLWMADRFAGVGGLKLANPLKAVTSPQKKLVSNLFKSYGFATRFSVVLVLVLAAFGLLRTLTARYQDEKSTMAIGLLGAVGLALVTSLVMHYPQYVYIPETGIFLTALGTLMVSLISIVALMRSLVIDRVGRLFHETIFKSDLRAMGLGVLVTALVQSSSITTSLAVPLAGAGIITVNHVFPFALGANVGTTITALLAALAAGKSVGLAIAFAHLLFNLLGISVWYPLRQVPIYLSGKLAELSLRSRAAPVAFIIMLYFFVPLVLITLMR